MIPEAVVWIGTAGNTVECSVLAAQIHHGRDDPSSQPEASSASIELYGPLPAEAVIGARVAVIAKIGAATFTRFVGAITDLGVSWDTVDDPVPRIIAVGDLGRTGRRIVGDSPWPAELDGERVNRILALAGFTPPALLTDPGTVTVLARDVDAQPAQTVAAEAAEDGGGIVWEDVDGRIRYADALHRRGASIAYEFRACDIGIGLTWEQTLEGLVNDVRVGYGPVPEGGEQPQVSQTDAVSVAARGLYGATIATRISSAIDAQARADTIVARQANPSWLLGGLEANLELYDDADTASVLGLDTHSLVSVTGLPAGSPATSALAWVEGWRETIEGGGGWRIAYATSDYCRTAGAPRWDDMPSAATWDTTDPAKTWNGAYCLPPQPPRGRWDDVAASLRWDLIPASQTWDTWPT